MISTRLRKSIESEMERNNAKLQKAKAEVAALTAANAQLAGTLAADDCKDSGETS